MPTYQYRCTECGHEFEQVQKFSDDALTHCPVCEGRLRKVFNAVGVVFKGSGFYRTDSRTGSSSTVPATATTPASGSSPDSPASGASSSGPASGPPSGSATETSSPSPKPAATPSTSSGA